MTRAFRRWVCRVMVGVLVFAQMSIAAHACPALHGFGPENVSSSPAAEATEMPACADAMPAGAPSAATESSPWQLDPASPALCAAHCDYGRQSADHAAAPTVQAALLTTLYTLPPLAAPAGRARPLSDQPIAQAASSPPLAILHCCFRI